MAKAIKNPEQPEATKSEELTTDEVIKKIQEAYRSGFRDGLSEASKLLENEDETDEE